MLKEHELVIISCLFTTLHSIYVIRVPLLVLSLPKNPKSDHEYNPLLAYTILRIQSVFRACQTQCLLVNNFNPSYLCVCLTSSST